MSYHEALANEVPIRKDRYGANWYYPPCHICGREVGSRSYNPALKYKCKMCKMLNRKVALPEQEAQSIDAS